MSRTVVTVGGGSTHVLVKGGAGKSVTLDKRTSARIANNRPNTQIGSQGSKIDVQAKPTTVWTGSAMGIQGPPGIDGDAHYEHTQSVPSATWTVTHGLNKFPSVTVVTSAGDLILSDVDVVDQNTAVLTFAAPFSGVAYFN